MKGCIRAVLLGTLAVSISTGSSTAAPAENRVTILNDAFGKPSHLKKDWGYSALIEYGGKRILFDTGNDPDIFRHNVDTLKIDLKKLDFVVISHRHGDHTSGLSQVLRVNPAVTIYTPSEISGFGTPVPAVMMAAINSHDPALPPDMHYFDGAKKDPWPSGSPWPRAHFKQIDQSSEIAPGIVLISTISDVSGTKEMHEISLAIRTPNGLVLVVGCSHPASRRSFRLPPK